MPTHIRPVRLRFYELLQSSFPYSDGNSWDHYNRGASSQAVIEDFACYPAFFTWALHREEIGTWTRPFNARLEMFLGVFLPVVMCSKEQASGDNKGDTRSRFTQSRVVTNEATFEVAILFKTSAEHEVDCDELIFEHWYAHSLEQLRMDSLLLLWTRQEEFIHSCPDLGRRLLQNRSIPSAFIHPTLY